MATGRDRAERLNERLRGAQRVDVGSDGFNLDIEGIDQPFNPPSSSSPPVTRSLVGAQQSPEIPVTEEPNPPASSPERPPRIPRSSPRGPGPFQEEITESPAGAPGSGHRRRVPVQDASASTARMMGIMDDDSVQPLELPSLNRPSSHNRPRDGTQIGRPARSPSDTAPHNGRHEESPDDSRRMPPPRVPRPSHRAPPARNAPADSPSADEAEEIGDEAAAFTIGQKRPRLSLQPSPELGSEESEADPTEERPAPKRARPVARREPAVQRQPKRRNAGEGQPKKRGRPRKDAAQKSARPRAGSEDDAIIEVTVQRFVNGEEVGSDEEAQNEIPFANRNSETVVDVFAQICEEVIATTLGKYQFLLDNTPDDAKKKESRIKMRAIEAFREEVSAQLLQHSIYLNHWYSLRKRIRHVQKEKLELRQEILRLKAEKEQVALRMDGVRARSEKEDNDSKHRLSASHLMNDIDLAVERGRDEAELSSRARKEAELGNLELLISQVADQASSKGPTGGFLKQIQDFNAFLERAANALDSR